MIFLTIFGLATLIIFGLMTSLWFLSLLLKDSSIVDIFWGTGFVILAWVYFMLSPEGFVARKWLIVILTSIWGLRLSIHILLRNWGHGEDYRYQQWRQAAGSKWWWQSFFKVFLLQGFLMWLISAPLLAAQISPNPGRLIWLDYLGILIWVIGFVFEAGGDWQLAQFRSNPDNKGKLLNNGLWRYTRHPNYFGDASQWWGFYLIAVAAGGYWTIFSPFIMTFLLRRVSGVTMLEDKLKETKPGYQEYVETTNAFFPWFPRRKSHVTENLSMTGMREWHIARWSALAWLETVIKSIAITIGIYVFIQALFNRSFAWPMGFELVQFLILVLLSLGLVAAIFDRIHRREIISMIFVIFNNIGHWGITVAMLFVPGPGISFIYFIILMLVGDFVKMASFKIDQFSLPGVSRATLYSLTGVYLFGYFLILLFEILA